MSPRTPILLTTLGALLAYAILQANTLRLASEADRLKAQNELLAQRIYSIDEIDEVSGKHKVVALIEQAIKIEGLDWDDRQIEAMARLCWRESRYNPNLQNPRSTAFGMYQFLNSTWKHTGIDKTADPLLQTIAAVRYIEGRYGTPKDALAFHLEPKVINGELVHYY